MVLETDREPIRKKTGNDHMEICWDIDVWSRICWLKGDVCSCHFVWREMNTLNTPLIASNLRDSLDFDRLEGDEHLSIDLRARTPWTPDWNSARYVLVVNTRFIAALDLSFYSNFWTGLSLYISGHLWKSCVWCPIYCRVFGIIFGSSESRAIPFPRWGGM